MDKKLIIQLGVTTVLSFLTQYFFAIYAFFIFAIMLVQMIRKKKDKKIIKKYVVSHIVYGVAGILLFEPSIKHLLFSDRGLTNLGNSNYWEHAFEYIQHLAYAFTINNTNNSTIKATFGIIIFLTLLFKSSEVSRYFTACCKDCSKEPESSPTFTIFIYIYGNTFE